MGAISNGMQEAALRLDATDTLISLPEVCTQLNKMLDDPNHSREDVAKLILCDPALTARILRMVNSSFYSFSAQVKTINHALNILSERELKSLVFVSSLCKNMDHIGKNLDMPRFWKKSVYCGLLAEKLSCISHMEDAENEEFFICGLILNIGKLLLYYWEPDVLDQILNEVRTKGRVDHEVEREYLGYTHADIGSSLATRWNFSELLANSIANHHNFSPETGPENPVMYSADLISAHTDHDSRTAPDLEQLNLASLADYLHISSDELQATLEATHEEFMHIYESLFGAP